MQINTGVRWICGAAIGLLTKMGHSGSQGAFERSGPYSSSVTEMPLKYPSDTSFKKFKSNKSSWRQCPCLQISEKYVSFLVLDDSKRHANANHSSLWHFTLGVVHSSAE